MATRDQEFAEVRRMMGHPKAQAPSADDTVSSLIHVEQLQMNKLNNNGRGWSSPTPASVVVEADTNDYSVGVSSGFGKAMFAYRELDDNVIVPVPFTDYINEFANQSYDSVLVPLRSGQTPTYSGEKLAFYRDDAGLPRVRVYPTPAEARTYKIAYATGALDWSTFDWPDESQLPEWTHLRCLTAAYFDIRKCEWTGLTEDQNKAKRAEYRSDLSAMIAAEQEEFNAYIKNPQHEPTISSVGAWFEPVRP